MELWMIIGIGVLGVIFLVLEIFLLPGSIIVGVLGALVIIGSVVLAYHDYGSKTGHIYLGTISIVTVFLLIKGIKKLDKGDWSVKASINQRVNLLEKKYEKGQKGHAFSDIRPSGKAVFDGERLEVHSVGEYIVKGQEIQIVKIEGNKIIVKKTQ